MAFLPTLSPFDVERAAQLIQQAYAPLNSQVSPEEQRHLQQELFDIQKRPEAWGLVVPFMDNPDPNVQFFGAHTAQVKIARDWESFPEDNRTQLRDLVLELTAHSIITGRSGIILRKFFVTLSSLALKLAPVHPTLWPDWIIACVTYLSGRGAATEHVLDFLSIVAEEVETADLIGPNKARMKQTVLDAVPMVLKAITSSITQPRQSLSVGDLRSALKCLEAWMSYLPGNEITTCIPILISYLDPLPSSSITPEFDDAVFVPASDALQELMTKSTLSDGSGSKTLTEPLLIWLERWGAGIIENTLNTSSVDQISHSLCKLLVSLGDHSTPYLASNISSIAQVPSSAVSSSGTTLSQTKGHLVQTFLKMLMAYTALPGYYGEDEEESEMTLGFWYLFQEALWSTNYYFEDGEDGVVPGGPDVEGSQWIIAKAVYRELVQVLRRKVVWPPQAVLGGWAKDQKEKFRCYRRDIGDTLINAYYVLRDDMLRYYTDDIVERLSNKQEHQGWEEIEATLHCVMSIQEAVPQEHNHHLARLFSPEILGRLPTAGHNRVRRTTLGIIGTYASWFITQPTDDSSSTTPLLMNTISYVVAALPEPSLCLEAANALRDLCDANRTTLAPHIDAFAEVHAGLSSIPDSEKGRVLQSIASVIQALPPEEGISPVEAIVSPVVAKLVEALHSSEHLPEESRTVALIQLQTLSGIAKGLTRITDLSLALDETTENQTQYERLKRAYEDQRMVKLREAMFGAIRTTVDLWSTDAGISDALSDFFKSTTSLPSDITLLSLPAGPILELVCLSSQRHLTSVWLSLASMLIIQLDPPSFLPSTTKSGPTAEAEAILSNVLPVLLQTSLSSFSQQGSMESNPDVVQAFFGCMEPIACHFIESFYRLPPGGLDALIQCAVSSLALQERYSLVAACTFLGTFINCSSSVEQLAKDKANLIQVHGRSILRALLCGFAGVAPRSVVPNLIELLLTLVNRAPARWKAWMTEIMFADDFLPSKAGPEAKDRFIRAIQSSRAAKRIREAAQQFTLVARGLEGTSFGYATVSM